MWPTDKNCPWKDIQLWARQVCLCWQCSIRSRTASTFEHFVCKAELQWTCPAPGTACINTLALLTIPQVKLASSCHYPAIVTTSLFLVFTGCNLMVNSIFTYHSGSRDISAKAVPSGHRASFCEAWGHHPVALQPEWREGQTPLPAHRRSDVNSIVNVHIFLRQQLRKQNSVYVVLPIITLWIRSIAWILGSPS